MISADIQTSPPPAFSIIFIDVFGHLRRGVGMRLMWDFRRELEENCEMTSVIHCKFVHRL